MALRKITFSNSTVTAVDHASLYHGIIGDGRINGCSCSIASGVISITKGYLMACGRLIENTASLSVTPIGNGVAQVVLIIDASGDGDISYEVRVANDIGSLAPLIKEDINDGIHTDYELELCVADLSSNNKWRKQQCLSMCKVRFRLKAVKMVFIW